MSFNVFSKNCQLNLLSDSDCLDIVRRSHKVGRLVYHDLQYRSENTMGFLGEYLSLEVGLEDDANNWTAHPYFVKSLPILHGEEGTMEAIFKKEADMYKEVLDKIAVYSKIKWKPQCYLARSDLIVMEDLMHQEHLHVPAYVNLNVSHIKAALHSLAAMHASSIVYEKKSGVILGKEYQHLLFETTVQRNVEWFTTGIRCVLDVAKIHPKYQSPYHQDFIAEHFEAMLEPVYEMANESKKYRNVICHRDAWRNNMLFVFKDNDFTEPLSCTLVDFQFCRYCPPAVDVLFCLYLNLRKEIRQEREKECLRWYHDCLKAELAHFGYDIDDHIPWESFLKSCDHIKLFPILYNGLAATVIQVPKGILRDIQNHNPEMYRKFRTVDRSEVILEVMQRDENFKAYMLEAVEELLEELLTRKSFEIVQS